MPCVEIAYRKGINRARTNQPKYLYCGESGNKSGAAKCQKHRHAIKSARKK